MRTPRVDIIEDIVDAVADKLDVDTGTLQEDKFKAAVAAAKSVLQPFIDELESFRAEDYDRQIGGD